MISRTNGQALPSVNSPPAGAGEKEIVVSLRLLNASQVRAIDRALQEIGDFGEVRLIVNRGHLRFIGKLTTQALLPEE